MKLNKIFSKVQILAVNLIFFILLDLIILVKMHCYFNVGLMLGQCSPKRQSMCGVFWRQPWDPLRCFVFEHKVHSRYTLLLHYRWHLYTMFYVNIKCFSFTEWACACRASSWWRGWWLHPGNAEKIKRERADERRGFGGKRNEAHL